MDVRHNQCKELVFRILSEQSSPKRTFSVTSLVKALENQERIIIDRKTVSRALSELRDSYGLDEEGKQINCFKIV